MYHKLSMTESDFLTVAAHQLEQQMSYLQTNGYQFVTSAELVDYYYENKILPQQPVHLVFDDAYISVLELAYPILKKYGAKATVLVPTAYVGLGSNWDESPAPIMSLEQLQNLDPSVFSLALHTHTHQSYKKLSLSEIEEDIDACLNYFTTKNLPFTPVFTYAYGARPKDIAILRGIKTHFQKRGIKAAFRIGNHINRMKANDLYELNRIDVRGTDSHAGFIKKYVSGKYCFLNFTSWIVLYLQKII